MIVHEEMARWGTRGTDDGVIGGMTIALPTVLNFGSPELKKKIVPEVLSGRKRMALAITEVRKGQ